MLQRVVELAVLLSAQGFRTSSERATPDDLICSYELHLHGDVSRVLVTPENLLFKSGSVLVVEGKDGLRHLALRDDSGGCHEQSRMLCQPKSESFLMAGAKPRAGSASHAIDDPPDHCRSRPCHANAN